jgi:LytS/YehU family sensor histidine kinase
MLTAVGRIAAHTTGARIALSVAAIAVGAAAGEVCASLFAGRGDVQDLHLMIARVLRWTLVGGSIAAMAHLWRGSAQARAEMQAAELRRSQLERQTAQMRLQLLRSRIEPHFLFNTLATVRRLHQTDPVQGADLLEQFLSYLRLTLESEDGGRGTLGQELDLVAAYLNVAVTRMSGRLTLRWDVPDELRACDLPPLTIATLVENAVKHGIAPHAAGGSIEVRARAVDARLEVSVADTGVGFDASGSGGSGIGLANIRARLATLYGTEAVLELHNNVPRGAVALMRLPRQINGAAG